jgi:5-methylcytosine-specific restriction endonuclease McrA
VVRKGTDITAVAHAGRTIPAALRTAVQARYPTCAVAGCDVRHQLEIDHVLGLAQGGLTTYENLVRLCVWQHMLKTIHEYRLVGSHGDWKLVGPDPPGG